MPQISRPYAIQHFINRTLNLIGRQASANAACVAAVTYGHTHYCCCILRWTLRAAIQLEGISNYQKDLLIKEKAQLGQMMKLTTTPFEQ